MVRAAGMQLGIASVKLVADGTFLPTEVGHLCSDSVHQICSHMGEKRQCWLASYHRDLRVECNRAITYWDHPSLQGNHNGFYMLAPSYTFMGIPQYWVGFRVTIVPHPNHNTTTRSHQIQSLNNTLNCTLYQVSIVILWFVLTQTARGISIGVAIGRGPVPLDFDFRGVWSLRTVPGPMVG